MMSHQSSIPSLSRGRLVRLLLLLILVSAHALPVAYGEERTVVGRVRGTVKDAENEPLQGLLVQLLASDGSGTLRITGTDEKGRYLFRDLPAGPYNVQIAADGYRPVTKGEIAVRPPFQNIVDFRLKRQKSPAAAAAPAAGATLRPAQSDGTPTVSVRGDLTDKDRRPVVEVSVTLVSHEGMGIYQAFSGLDGRFVVERVPPGQYRAVIASPGHVTLDLRSVGVSAESGLDLSLTLVDYPLNLRNEEKDERLPPEKPIQVPETVEGSTS